MYYLFANIGLLCAHSWASFCAFDCENCSYDEDDPSYNCCKNFFKCYDCNKCCKCSYICSQPDDTASAEIPVQSVVPSHKQSKDTIYGAEKPINAP